MKKQRNKIENKVFFLALRMALIALLTIAAIAFVSLLLLRSATSSISRNLAAEAAQESEAVLEEQAVQELGIAAKGKASLSDEQLYLIEYFANLLAEEAERILSYPEIYHEVEVHPPLASEAGRYSVQLLVSRDADTAAVARAAALQGNLQDLMLSIPENSTLPMSIYIGYETGYALMADEIAHLKDGYYEAQTRPWYTAAAEARGLVWTDIYEDNYGRGLSITCTVPFYGADGTLHGVVGIDVSLSGLSDISSISRLDDTAQVYLINNSGQLIAEDTSDTGGGAAGIRENLFESVEGRQRELVKSMIAGGEGVEIMEIEGMHVFLAYAPLETLGWSLAIVMPVQDVMAPVRLNEQRMTEMQNAALKQIDRTIGTVVLFFLLALLLLILIISRVSRRFARTFTTPVKELQTGVQAIASGNLENRIDLRTRDEIEDLGNAVNSMAVDLQTYINDLQSVTSERERIGAELSIATEIQASMLPCIFPPFPDRSEFELYAAMQPAKEVGGDFYDFFLVDDDTLAVVVADASGKGVPAALFMVIAKTLIKNNAQNGMSPAEVFETVNNLLCENNRTGMFVTAFMGYLEISTGRFTYVNAGHTHPLLRKAGGAFELLKLTPGMVLAAIDGIPFKQFELQLEPGDELFLYTDGITEMMNREQALFGEERLIQAANEAISDNDLLEHIKLRTFQFADGADQADDITMVSLKLCDQAKDL